MTKLTNLRHQGLINQHKKVYTKIRSRFLDVDILNEAILAQSLLGTGKKVNLILQKMFKLNIRPDINTINNVLLGLKRRKSRKALYFTRTMCNNYNIQPTTETINHVLDTFYSIGDVRRLIHSNKLFQQFNVPRDSHSYITLIKGCLGHSRGKIAYGLFESCPLALKNQTMFNLIFVQCAIKNEFDKLSKVLEEMKQNKVEMCPDSLQQVMKSMYNNNESESIPILINCIINHNFLNQETATDVMKVLCEQLDLKNIQSLFNCLNSSNLLSTQAHEFVIVACISDGQDEAAKQLNIGIDPVRFAVLSISGYHKSGRNHMIDQTVNTHETEWSVYSEAIKCYLDQQELDIVEFLLHKMIRLCRLRQDSELVEEVRSAFNRLNEEERAVKLLSETLLKKDPLVKSGRVLSLKSLYDVN
ncbi:PCMP-E96 [Acrasis kona]|uniref:PCMP-E96 n=1 Tax=Acrasis kona TaxID=1008807 RepID=A0AAW2Z3C0_9EUKA